MKNTAKIMTFKLSVLTTLMLCVTANNASDIEIYKAPTKADGKAKIMFVLDVSSYMYEDPKSSGGSGGGPSGIESAGPFEADFGITCKGNPKSFLEIRHSTTPYKYTANYCETTTETPKVKAGCFTALQRPGASPAIPAGTYRCYDRLSNLKEALMEVVDNPIFAAAEAGDTSGVAKPEISLGFSFYPTTPKFGPVLAPQLLNNAGRDALKKRISDLDNDEILANGEGLPFPTEPSTDKTAQVAQAYGRGVAKIIETANSDTTAARQCSGYGVYMVSGRTPEGDVSDGADGAVSLLTNALSAEEKAKAPFNAVCSGLNSKSTDGNSWRCVKTAAEYLMAGKASINMPIRTAVVSMGLGVDVGASFGFYGIDSRTDFPEYKTTTTVQDIKDRYKQIFDADKKYQLPLLADRSEAIQTGVAGGGGYYAVSNVAALKQSIDDFISKTLKVDIPYLTTGAPTIPQDPLNPVLVQDDAYYSQFKPTPTTIPEEASRLWVGNMKKYEVNSSGRLRGKSNREVIDILGRLVVGTHDLWAPNVSTDEATATANERTPGSELFARMGGVWSQLQYGPSTDSNGNVVENRKVLTNRVVSGATATGGTTLKAIKRSDYATGATAANDPRKADILKLLDLPRQMGAVMHSSPLLLSNQGKMTYNASTKQLESSGREDYVLFGSTQGLLHVVKADDYTSTNGGGKEIFAFVPHEMIEKQYQAFSTPESTLGGTANLFYGIDAPWVAYTEYVPKADGTLTVGTGKPTTGTTTLKGKQFVYGGLRMGGRSYYALDLKDMNDPKLKFHINPDAASSGPLSYMGESWSKPKIAWVNWQGKRTLVMFVGGGYDAGGVTGSTAGISSKANNGGYESDTYDQTNGIGAGVYMFRAEDETGSGTGRAGDLLWWASNNASATTAATTNSGVIALKDANMKYSVASEIKTADRNNDGLVDHLYFGDLGGQVFRIDLNNNASTSGAFATRSTRIMNMHASGGTSPRFYAAPSFAIFEDSASGNLFAAISIGSGNLSHPLAGYDSGRNQDALYTVYDKDVTRSDLYTTSSLNTQDAAVGASGGSAINELTIDNRFQQDLTTQIAPYASSAGWYYKLKGGTKIQHEKIFYSPTVIDYDLYVSSYDASRLGLTGACGGGVQGVSKVQIFCMPFGQCSAADYPSRTNTNYSDDHGPGIQNHAIASGGDGTTRLVGGAIIGNNLTDTYATKVKLIAQRWYER